MDPWERNRGRSKISMRLELHVITDDSVLSHRNFIANATGVLTSGVVKVFHLRGPGTSLRKLVELAEALSPIAKTNGTKFVVNDRVDLALMYQTDGVRKPSCNGNILSRRDRSDRAIQALYFFDRLSKWRNGKWLLWVGQSVICQSFAS